MKNYSIIFQQVNYFRTLGVFTLIASEKNKSHRIVRWLLHYTDF